MFEPVCTEQQISEPLSQVILEIRTDAKELE